jgi:hypothetical protein
MSGVMLRIFRASEVLCDFSKTARIQTANYSHSSVSTGLQNLTGGFFRIRTSPLWQQDDHLQIIDGSC